MGVTTPGNHDEGVTLEVVNLAGLELIFAPDGEQCVRAVEDLSAVHLLCTVATDATELVVGVAETSGAVAADPGSSRIGKADRTIVFRVGDEDRPGDAFVFDDAAKKAVLAARETVVREGRLEER